MDGWMDQAANLASPMEWMLRPADQQGVTLSAGSEAELFLLPPPHADRGSTQVPKCLGRSRWSRYLSR